MRNQWVSITNAKVTSLATTRTLWRLNNKNKPLSAFNSKICPTSHPKFQLSMSTISIRPLSKKTRLKKMMMTMTFATKDLARKSKQSWSNKTKVKHQITSWPSWSPLSRGACAPQETKTKAKGWVQSTWVGNTLWSQVQIWKCSKSRAS